MHLRGVRLSADTLGLRCYCWCLLRGKQWDFLAPFLDPILPYIFVGSFAYSFVVWPYLAARSTIRAELRGANFIGYTLSEGVAVLSSGMLTHHDWTTILRAKQTSSLFLLQHSSGLITVLPKRCLSKPENLSACRELLAQHVSRKTTTQRSS